mmetsp:Transcript_58730/g.135426  ORF Transcript_58730/g.135426 Transcript_58730/m.135426 type:complete len:228 (-) Transcript_58730:715-1398(-)
MAALAVANGGRPSPRASLLVDPGHSCLRGLEDCVQSGPVLISAVFVPSLAVGAVVVGDPVQLLWAVAGDRTIEPTHPDNSALQRNNLPDTSQLIQLIPMDVLPVILIVLGGSRWIVVTDSNTTWWVQCGVVPIGHLLKRIHTLSGSQPHDRISKTVPIVRVNLEFEAAELLNGVQVKPTDSYHARLRVHLDHVAHGRIRQRRGRIGGHRRPHWCPSTSLGMRGAGAR